MKLTITQSENAGPIRMGGNLDIYSAPELREALLRQLEHGPGVSLDLSAVTACDPVAVQLLCSARRSAVAARKPFRIVEISEPVARACAALGVTSEQLALS